MNSWNSNNEIEIFKKIVSWHLLALLIRNTTFRNARLLCDLLLQIEDVIDSDNGSISSIQILNSQMVKEKKMWKKDVEALLDRFSREKWLNVVSCLFFY